MKRFQDPSEAAQILKEKIRNSEIITIAPMTCDGGFRGRIDCTEEALLSYCVKVIEVYSHSLHGMLPLELFTLLLKQIGEQVQIGPPYSHPKQEAERLRERIEVIAEIVEKFEKIVERKNEEP